MTKEKHHPKRWLSGERAKDFRRRLGASDGGKDSGKHTFTFKFPLAAEQPDEKTRDFLRLQYEKLASIEEKLAFSFFSRRCIYPAFAFLQTEPTPPPLRKNRLF